MALPLPIAFTKGNCCETSLWRNRSAGSALAIPVVGLPSAVQCAQLNPSATLGHFFHQARRIIWVRCVCFSVRQQWSEAIQHTYTRYREQPLVRHHEALLARSQAHLESGTLRIGPRCRSTFETKAISFSAREKYRLREHSSQTRNHSKRIPAVGRTNLNASLPLRRYFTTELAEFTTRGMVLGCHR